MNVWSTEHISPRERFAFWNDAVCAAFLKVTTHRTVAAPFQGRLHSTAVGGLLINSIESAAYEVDNCGKQWAADDQEWLFVNVHHQGRCRLLQSGRTHNVYGRGEFSLNAGVKRFSLDFLEPIRLTCFRLPYDAVASRVADLGAALARPLPDSGAARLFAGYVEALTANAADLPERCGDRASETFRDLLALAIGVNLRGAESARQSARRELFLQSCARVRFSLGNSRFDIGTLSAGLRLAPRTLQAMFKENGTTFTTFLLEERLLAAQAQLRDPDGCSSVSQVAYSVGFSDLSYFSRAFRRRFEVSPTEFRDSLRMA
jgi:AraC family transcriptional activator of tynA and feaB